MSKDSIVGYQIGYRTVGIGGYKHPYFGLPMFMDADYADSLGAAEEALKRLREDFPNAEWRMIEVWE